MKLADFPEIAALPTDDKIALVDEIWNSIAADGLPPISEEFRAELDRRRAAHLADPSTGRTWEQVKERARVAVREVASERAARGTP